MVKMVFLDLCHSHGVMKFATEISPLRTGLAANGAEIFET